MKTNVLLGAVLCLAVAIATLGQAEICTSSFGYLPGPPTNDSLCNTQSAWGTNGYTCAPAQITIGTNLVWVWNIPDPAAKTDVYLAFGDSGYRFSLINRVWQFEIQGVFDNLYDGARIEVSPDSIDGMDGVWYEVTSVGGTLSVPYNATLRSGSSLAGQQAWTGNVLSAQQTVIVDGSRINLGTATTCMLRFHLSTDSHIGRSGLNVISMKTLGGPIDSPYNARAAADNGTLYLLGVQHSMDDTRYAYSVYEYRRNGGNWTSLGNITLPYQVNNNTMGVTVANGDTWEFRVTDYDIWGKDGGGPVSFEPTTLTPSCTGVPSWVLLLMTKTSTYVEGSWVSQTFERNPCGSGNLTASGYKVYRSTSPTGPWTLVASGDSSTLSFFDSNATLDNTLYFYKVDSLE